MADSSERVGVELYLDLTTYNRQVADAVASAGEVEAAWKASLGNIGGDLSLKVNVDMGDLSTVSRSLADLAAEDANIRILADDGELVSAQRKIEDIDSSAPTVPVDADDTELDSAKRKVDDLDSETASVKVDADTSGADSALDDIKQQLEDLKGLAVIDLVMQASGPALGLLEKAIDLVTSTDEAVRTLAARTGQDIPRAGEIIDRLYTSNWGESKQQIAETLAYAQQLGFATEDIGGAAESAFGVASVTGKDVNEVLRAQSQLIKSGVVDNYGEAADFFVVAYQNGLDVGDDLLDSTVEYATTLKSLGFTGSQALAALNSGLETGIDNTDRIVDLFREFNIRASNVDETAAQEAFATLNLADEADMFRQGELSGPDFFDGVVAALQNVDPAQRQQLGTAIFGTIFEDFGSESVLDITTADSTFDTIDGRAQESADLINDTLGRALNTLFRNVEVEAQNFLSSDQINLDQKIDDIKNGITSTLQALGEGEDLAGALEIGLAIPGFADSVHRFEASIGEFAIGVLELIAGVQDFLGKDSSGTRGQIATLAEGQLAFNIKVANPDEIQGEIDRAVSRGVSPDAIRTALTTAGQELIDAGEIERAQQIVDTFSEIQYAIAPGLDQIKTVAAEIALREIDAGTFTQEMIDNAVGEGFIVPVEIDETGLQEQLTQLQTWEDAFAQIQQSAQADSPVANLLENIGITSETVTEQEGLFGRLTEAGRQTLGMDIPESADTAAQSVEDADRRIASAMTGNTMTTSFETVEQVAASTMARVAESVGSAVKIAVAAEVAFTNQTNILKGALLGLIGEAGPGILALAQNLQNVASGASVAAQTFSAATSAAAAAAAAGGISEFASGGEAAGVFSVGEQGRELVVSGEPVSVLNNRSTNAIFNAIRSAAFGLAGGGGGAVSGGGNRNTFNFYTQSDAQAVLAGREVSRNLRGQ